MTAKSGNRIAYLDALKAVSILLVVYCHFPLLSAESVPGNIFMTLAWGAVPCFMMVSGALMHSKSTFSWKKYLIRLIKTYLVFCFWRVVYLIIYANIRNMVPGKMQVIKYTFLFNDLQGIDASVMWYMIAYMICLLIYPLTFYAFKNKTGSATVLKVFMLAVTGFSGIIIPELTWLASVVQGKVTFNLPDFSELSNIMPFTNYSHMIFYFVLGTLLYENREKIEKWFGGKKWLASALIILGVAGLMCVKYVDFGIWSWGGKYMTQGYNRIFTAIIALGMYFSFNVFKFDKFYDIIGKTIGTNTMGIYYFHWAFLSLCSYYLYDKLPNYFFGMNAIKAIVITLIAVVLTVLIKKIPFIRNIVS